MELTHGYLLGGLLLTGIPILVHLIMRQKPRQLPFPAFRFLRQRALINRRKLQLQHWLLLALRILFVVVLVLALAHPLLASRYLPHWLQGLFPASGDRQVRAVFVFDTSYSMDYRVKAQSRLDLARQYALELHRDMPEGSQIAVLDTGEDGGDEDWITTPAQVRARLNGLRLRPVQVPLTRQIARATEMLQLDPKSQTPPLPLLYVFSDRTRTSWDPNLAQEIHIDQGGANPLTVTYLDLGIDEPEDVAIDEIKVEPTVVAPGERVQVSVIVRATGTSFNDYVLCHFDNDLGLPQRQRLSLNPGKAKVVTFNVKAPPRAPGSTGPYQALAQLTVGLGTADNRPYVDALAFNNSAHATFLVREDTRREGRKVLTLVDKLTADNPKQKPVWYYWKRAIWAYGEDNPTSAFACDVRTLADAEKLTPKQLESYRVVCLFETANPSAALWERLKAYVQGGGGLILIPGGEEMVEKKQVADFNEAAAAHKLLPARLKEIVTLPPDRSGFYWIGYDSPHPLLLQFREMIRSSSPDFSPGQPNQPFVFRYWKVEPLEKEGVIVAYTDPAKSPALVEKVLDRGRVVQFTTLLDLRKFDGKRRWNNYWESSFGLVLSNVLCGYLAGDVNAVELNFPCGQPVLAALPPGTPANTLFKLDGPDPDLSDSERGIQVGKEAAEAGAQPLPQAVAPGNWRLLDRSDQRVAAFSLNVRPDESQLDRVPKEDVEAVLGKDAVLAPGEHVKLADTLRGSSSRPIDLLPLLMMLILLVLTFEGALANRFYKRDTPSPGGAGSPAGEPPAPRETQRSPS